MTGTERRAHILDSLRKSTVPISGSDFARTLSVSRQIIVQDIAIIRAAGYDIISTNKGYLLKQRTVHKRTLKFTHAPQKIAEELTTIVDLGGTIEDIYIYHKLYGKLKADLNIRSRRDIKDFLQAYEADPEGTMKSFAVEYHYHTIQADTEETLDQIEQALTAKHLLTN